MDKCCRKRRSGNKNRINAETGYLTFEQVAKFITVFCKSVKKQRFHVISLCQPSNTGQHRQHQADAVQAAVITCHVA
jgi:hypothetical protein